MSIDKITKPRRVQRKRTKGWKMPPNTVYVGRSSRWGNPWTVGIVNCNCRSHGECYHNLFNVATPEEAVELYRERIFRLPPAFIDEVKEKLRGKNLACWCPLNQPCHADVLLELANKEKNYE